MLNLRKKLKKSGDVWKFISKISEYQEVLNKLSAFLETTNNDEWDSRWREDIHNHNHLVNLEEAYWMQM